MTSQIVPPEINSRKPGGVVLVGRDPGKQEVEYRYDEMTGKKYPHGRPFVGPAGQVLDQCVSAGGFQRTDFAAIANTVNVQPRDNEFKRHNPADVEEGLRSLSELLSQLKPTLIITLGNEAAYAILGDIWPTAGRGIYGAKSIEDRRGYFWWSARYNCWVLTAGHPAAALRKAVPGYYLLETDFRRARRWLDGELPREELPKARPLTMSVAHKLAKHSFLACDIETKWDNTAVEMVGWCGDDLVPYVAWSRRGMETASKYLLTSPVWKVVHNGPFDYFLLKEKQGTTMRGYVHDTMDMWRALAPELAGQDDSGEEGESARGGRLTRKGLGFLPTVLTYNIEMNVEWWKDYPTNDDPDYMEKMVQLNAVDAWITRRLADSLLAAIIEEDVWEQYWEKRDMQPALFDVQSRGLRVNEELRAEREELLVAREEEKKERSSKTALAFIERYNVKEFELWRRCECCGGGSQAREHCWRCGGLPSKPTKKQEYVHLMDATSKKEKKEQLKQYTVQELKEMLPPCSSCAGVGKTMTHEFNPFSTQQLITLLYGPIGAPTSYFKGKPRMDEMAMKKVLAWAKGGKNK